MNTFFSILSIKTNSYSEEKVTVGVMAIASQEVFYAYSKSKLNLLDKLVFQSGLTQFAGSILKQYEHTVKETNANLKSGQISLIQKTNLFTKDYFDYLSKYNNGAVQFSEPVVLNKDFTKEDFENYYAKFVGEPISQDKEKPVVSFYKKVKPLIHKENIEQKADVNFEFNPQEFLGILKTTQIPLLTKNGAIQALQLVDFEKQFNTIVNHFYETKIIHNALSKFSEKKGLELSKIKIGFEKPANKTEQFKVFNMAFKEYKNDFEFITLDEIDDYTNEIVNSNNVTFSSLLK